MRVQLVLSISAIALFLTACTGRSETEQWVASQKQANQNVSRIENDLDIAPNERVEIYHGEGLLSPLDQNKLFRSIQNAEIPECIQVEMDRRRDRPDPLEVYPINLMQAVGYMKETSGRKAMTLIQVGGSQNFEAYIGQRIGLDYGRITNITETEISITEVTHLPGTNTCEERYITLKIEKG